MKIVNQRIIALVCVFGLMGLYTQHSVAQTEANTAQTQLLKANNAQYALDKEIRQQAWADDQLHWADTISEINRLLNSPGRFEEADIERYRLKMERLISNVKKVKKRSKTSLVANDLLLDALGARSLSAQESDQIIATRAHLNQSHQFYLAQLGQIERMITSAHNVEAVLSQLARKNLFSYIMTQEALPFYPTTISTAVRFVSAQSTKVFTSARKWLSLHEVSAKIWSMLALSFIVIVLAVVLGNTLLKKFGRDPKNFQPTHARKITAALAEGIATGLIPIALIVTLYFLFNSVYVIDSELLYLTVNAALGALFALTVSISIILAVLSPHYPQWRLTELSANTSTLVGKGLIFLVVIFIINHLVFTFLKINPASLVIAQQEQGETASFIGTIFNLFKAGGLIYLSCAKCWHTKEDDLVEIEATALDTLWTLARMVVMALSLFAIAATLSGYIYLSGYISFGVFITIILLGLAYIVREAVHEMVAYVVKQKWFRRFFNLRIIALQRIKFWSGIIIDPLVYGSVLMVILPFWGLPMEKIWLWASIAFNGFEIGELNISLKGILLAILVFMLVIRLSRFVQKFTRQQIFSKSSSSLASQHNTLTIIKYIGATIAIGASIAALGVDYQTIAIIMGALSVGIGFGLRNVVSNFVSGILLLIEQPFKVGDWIQIGAHEGYVKELNFRSTEIETFQHASVIIPNADLIAQPVINLTFDNNKGRIELPLSVAYGSNPEQVKQILKDLAQAHKEVLSEPEPKVIFMRFGDNSLDFELRCFTADVNDRLDISSDLRYSLEKELNKQGIEIPFPQRVVHLKEQKAI